MSRGAGDQTWPFVRHIVGQGPQAVTISEWGDGGELAISGPGVRVHDDGTVTITATNLEHDQSAGEIRIVGKEVR